MADEILTCAEAGRADAFAARAGVPTLTLMENAGRAVADAVAARFQPCAALVLCGPGNNGGDGLVAARHLAARGFDVRLAAAGHYKGDAAAMAEKWTGPREKLSPQALNFLPRVAEQLAGEVPVAGLAMRRAEGVVIDGIFGAGLSRPLEGAIRDLVVALNERHLPVVAIDVPSGVAGDSGHVLGDVAVRADLTVTFFRKKPGHLLLPGRARCGEVLLADIGIPGAALDEIRPMLFENGPALWGARYPWPQPQGHKYARGHCVVVSGPAHATGAARMAARAALRVGAGLVSVASPPDAVAVNAAHLTAVMVKPFDGADGLGALLADRRFNAVVIGPGLGVGAATRALVGTVLASGARAVLDADALTSFRDDPAVLFRQFRPGAVVLTPHDGEFERLFPGLLKEAPSKAEAARAAAARSGAVVLLKGGDTVIARPPLNGDGGWAAINADAPPTLATAGAGDVLSGLIGGLLAQGMAAEDAAAAAAWLHGDAAARFGPGLIAEDIPEMLPESLAALKAGLGG